MKCETKWRFKDNCLLKNVKNLVKISKRLSATFQLENGGPTMLLVGRSTLAWHDCIREWDVIRLGLTPTPNLASGIKPTRANILSAECFPTCSQSHDCLTISKLELFCLFVQDFVLDDFPWNRCRLEETLNRIYLSLFRLVSHQLLLMATNKPLTFSCCFEGTEFLNEHTEAVPHVIIEAESI